VDAILGLLEGIPSARARRVFPSEPGIQPTSIPRVYVDLAPPAPDVSAVIQALRAGDPSIAVGQSRSSLVINPQMLEEGEERVVAARLREVLK